MISITFPDGSKLPYKKKKITPMDIAEDIGEGLARAALCAKVNGRLVDLSYEIKGDAEVKIITYKDDAGKEIFSHSSAHLLAAAVQNLFPGIKFGIGPAIEDGFYYDFGKKQPFTPSDLIKIEKEMTKLVAQDIRFERKEVSKEEASKLFEEQPYKLELLSEVEKPSIYTLGKFTDLCAGPHVFSTGKLKAFKLMKMAGAYWRGDSSKKQLQRIYGISFPEEKMLKKHLILLEEAEKRDHRRIGKQMELFSVHEEAPGMPFFHDKGTFIWEKLKDYMTIEMRKLGYEINKTPIILNKNLWLQSGHWDHYKESMYFTKIDNADYAVKPMNCPGNILIFKTRLHSYKELPIKAGEFGLVHRHELSGVLSGLFRVRVFTQDDAHVFCTEKQIKSQIIELIELVDRIYSTFGFDYEVELSTKPLKAMGKEELWDKAEKALSDALDVKKIKYKLNKGDGAFYGPKIDFHVKDSLGRKWQCGTIQLDFSMPDKFNLTYESEAGSKKRLVMIHRAIYGSLERFMGILIEHFAGFFPLWLAPVQVRVITISNKFNEYGEEVYNVLKKNGIRAEFNGKAETTSKKVRDSQISKIPLLITIGDKEIKENTISVRTNKDGKVKFKVKIEDLISKIKKNVDKKEIKFEI